MIRNNSNHEFVYPLQGWGNATKHDHSSSLDPGKWGLHPWAFRDTARNPDVLHRGFQCPVLYTLCNLCVRRSLQEPICPAKETRMLSCRQARQPLDVWSRRHMNEGCHSDGTTVYDRNRALLCWCREEDIWHNRGEWWIVRYWQSERVLDFVCDDIRCWQGGNKLHSEANKSLWDAGRWSVTYPVCANSWGTCRRETGRCGFESGSVLTTDIAPTALEQLQSHLQTEAYTL